MRDAREADRKFLQQFDQIIRRRFAFDIGRERKNHFVRLFPLPRARAVHRSANLPARPDRAAKSFRLTNGSGRETRWFFPAAKYRSAARRRKADRSARDSSAQISQSSSMVKNPQCAQGRTVARVFAIARAIRPADRRAPAPSRARSAPPSADRRRASGEVARSIPGSQRDTRSFSKRRNGSRGAPVRSQMESERLEPAQIQLQRRVVFVLLGRARFWNCA